MNYRLVSALCLITCMVVLGPAGCGHNSAPPPPLAVGQIRSEMEKGFKDAKPEIKEVAERLNSAVESKNYTAAYSEVQRLCEFPGETKEQQLLATRAMICITELLQTAQAQGDQGAASALELRKATR